MQAGLAPGSSNREEYKMATENTFTFHTDPGHGWVEVDLHNMRLAGLEPSSFSKYSYRKRNVFYLEEDCDASKFIAAWQEKTGLHAEFRNSYQAQTFIRNLPRIHD
jgi:hypothetical protein